MQFIKTRMKTAMAVMDRGIVKAWNSTGVPRAINKSSQKLAEQGRFWRAALVATALPLTGSVVVTLFNVDRFIRGSSGWLEHLVPVLIMLLAWLKTFIKIGDAYTDLLDERADSGDE